MTTLGTKLLNLIFNHQSEYTSKLFIYEPISSRLPNSATLLECIVNV